MAPEAETAGAGDPTGAAGDADKMHFRRMDEGTDADFAVLARVHEENIRKLPDLLMGLLTDLSADEAYPVDRLEHSLQTATRALRDGRDEEYVVCALLHDVGESLGPFNHGEVIAAVLRPFVSEANHWMLEHHPVFQVYFYGTHLGIDPDAREAYRSSPYFDRTAEFCALYDEVSFDPDYDSEPMSTFEPLVRRVLAKTWTPPA
ncbi:MAG: HD domain-containing protein [Acidimicrobiales bacterium]|jgi:predicted HD phosphohydrolase|nr:HD domain-containing protein [Acidimicrobiales bacterium]